jgi:hypothetical protein
VAVRAAPCAPLFQAEIVRCDVYAHGIELLQCVVAGAQIAPGITYAIAVRKYKKLDGAS